MQRLMRKTVQVTKEFFKELFVPQVMARGFNPNAGGAGPEGSLLVQGKLGLLPQVPGQSGRHSDGTLSKHKEKRNNYLPGAGFWN